MSYDTYKIGDKPVVEFQLGDNVHFKAMVIDSLEKPGAMPQLTIWSDTEKGWCMAVSQDMIDNLHTKAMVSARILEVAKRLKLFDLVSQKAD